MDKNQEANDVIARAGAELTRIYGEEFFGEGYRCGVEDAIEKQHEREASIAAKRLNERRRELENQTRK